MSVSATYGRCFQLSVLLFNFLALLRSLLGMAWRTSGQVSANDCYMQCEAKLATSILIGLKPVAIVAIAYGQLTLRHVTCS